jgi:hypothetical protein
VKTPGEEMRSSGMMSVVWGVGIGVVGVAAWAAVIAVPGLAFPGTRLLPLLLVAIPIGMAMAVRKGAGRTAHRAASSAPLSP